MTEKAAATSGAERRTASRAKAEATEPALKPGRSSGGIWRSIAVVLLLAGVTVAIVLLITGGDEDNTTVASDTSSVTTAFAAPATPPPTTPATPPPAAATPAPKPARASEQCDPIYGGGVPYQVVSSARGGADPAGCAEVRPVVLTALNENATEVEGWSCAIDLDADTIVTCKAGKQTVVAKR